MLAESEFISPFQGKEDDENGKDLKDLTSGGNNAGLKLLDALMDDVAYARYLLHSKLPNDQQIKTKINWKDQHSGVSLLHVLVYSDLIAPVKLLLSHKVDVNIKNKHNETPLHWCAKMNSTKTAKLLLDNRANANAMDNSMSTPLHYAASMGNLEVIVLLLDYGADATATDSDNSNPMELAAENYQSLSYKAILIVFMRHYQKLNMALPRSIQLKFDLPMVNNNKPTTNTANTPVPTLQTPKSYMTRNMNETKTENNNNNDEEVDFDGESDEELVNPSYLTKPSMKTLYDQVQTGDMNHQTNHIINTKKHQKHQQHQPPPQPNYQYLTDDPLPPNDTTTTKRYRATKQELLLAQSQSASQLPVKRTMSSNSMTNNKKQQQQPMASTMPSTTNYWDNKRMSIAMLSDPRIDKRLLSPLYGPNPNTNKPTTVLTRRNTGIRSSPSPHPVIPVTSSSDNSLTITTNDDMQSIKLIPSPSHAATNPVKRGSSFISSPSRSTSIFLTPHPEHDYDHEDKDNKQQQMIPTSLSLDENHSHYYHTPNGTQRKTTRQGSMLSTTSTSSNNGNGGMGMKSAIQSVTKKFHHAAGGGNNGNGSGSPSPNRHHPSNHYPHHTIMKHTTSKDDHSPNSNSNGNNNGNDQMIREKITLLFPPANEYIPFLPDPSPYLGSFFPTSFDIIVAIEHCTDCHLHQHIFLPNQGSNTMSSSLSQKTTSSTIQQPHDPMKYIMIANQILTQIITSILHYRLAVRLYAMRCKPLSTKRIGALEVSMAIYPTAKNNAAVTAASGVENEYHPSIHHMGGSMDEETTNNDENSSHHLSHHPHSVNNWITHTLFSKLESKRYANISFIFFYI